MENNGAGKLKISAAAWERVIAKRKREVRGSSWQAATGQKNEVQKLHRKHEPGQGIRENIFRLFIST